MGFLIQQAKDALGATQSGLDVQGPLEVLLGVPVGVGPVREKGEKEIGIIIIVMMYYQDGDRNHHNIAIDLTHLTKLHFPTNLLHLNYQPTQAHYATQLQNQEHINKLLAKLARLGMPSHANAFWRERKERARGIYKERGVPPLIPARGGRGTNGRIIDTFDGSGERDW
ncbi:hypothetical protein PILCRDRAFT_16682 [Piloderma croceum F 1598]|uniref:Uncharacterized protein n=1 Tax=Piloderma croceum (strain F 1598) TaxID=765440 RepID=A0A0C3EGN0_PILCF|nr:hypothetical protein PILCRDRAFT_16682 [Piloderma croceum F 1598]